MLLLLEKHLKPLQEQGVTIWHAGHIPAGSAHWQEREQYLHRTALFLPLVSTDYLTSEVCREELRIALWRRDTSATVVIPILLRPARWRLSQLRELQPLPRDQRPLSSSRSKEERLQEIATEIETHIVTRRMHGVDAVSPAPPLLKGNGAGVRRVARIVIEKPLEDCDDLLAITEQVRAAWPDPSFKLTKVEIGSIVLTIEISEEAAKLLQEGKLGPEQLSATLGIPVRDVSLQKISASQEKPPYGFSDDLRDYLERVNRRDRYALADFVQRYGPIIKSAVTKVYKRNSFGNRNIPTQEDLFLEVWRRFLERMDSAFKAFDSQKGTLSSYLWLIGSQLAMNYCREFNRDRNENLVPVNPSSPALSSSGLQDSIEAYDLTSRLLAEFQRECIDRPQRALPNDWDLFCLHFMEDVPKEEICERYKLTSNTYDKRIYRIRHRFQSIRDRLEKLEDETTTSEKKREI